ncbi:hypothetical protein LNO81_21990 [Klebsiella variicola subsp. variicola]|nr:hypothetical protein [Klebsiella variicola subsp. variicola]
MTIVAQQAQPVVLNDQGEGTVTLPIGDFNGELRVMAQAWTADDFGSSEDKSGGGRPGHRRTEHPALPRQRRYHTAGAGSQQSDR